jgi:hypothetical protein
MLSAIKLGGFKVLKDVDFFSFILHLNPGKNPARFCRLLARKEINLSYLTCLKTEHAWSMNIVSDTGQAELIAGIINENSGEMRRLIPDCVILSVFPHSRNPKIAGTLFGSLCNRGLIPLGLGTSSSAISIALERGNLNHARDTLFETFSFSSYRTPEDWTLAQKGSEDLYKEVVANYREAWPKVYGVEYHNSQQFVKLVINRNNMEDIGLALKEFSALEQKITFSAKGPGSYAGQDILTFCLTLSDVFSARDLISRIIPGYEIDIFSPVTIFSMNGPHFGDRYGIASRFLTAFQSTEVDILGMSCTIASITCAVNSTQKDLALSTIQECFKVPSIIKRD